MPYGGYGIQPWGFQWGDPNSALIDSSVSIPDIRCSTVFLSQVARGVHISASAISVSGVSVSLLTKSGTVAVSALHKPSVSSSPVVAVLSVDCA